MVSWPRSIAIAPVLALGCLAAVPAQTKTTPPKSSESQDQDTPGGWIERQKYDQRSSRQCFAACDSDGDDRLDIREAMRCLPNMGSLENPVGFRLLDANRDGFVHWDEFDGRYRRLVQRGGKFLFRPAHPLARRMASENATPRGETRAAIDLLMKMVTDDDDPHINKSEFLKLLTALKQPASLANSFPLLDQDHSGGLSAEELAEVIAKVPYLLELVKKAPRAGAEQTTSETQLHSRLLRIHPSLGRWSEKIFRTADRDGNGTLSQKELELPRD